MLVLTTAISLAGCGSGAPVAKNTPSPSPAPTRGTLLPLGFSHKTAKGSVVVYAYDSAVNPTQGRVPASGNRFVAVDAEGCAGKNADANTGIAPDFFYLQIGRFAYPPVAPAKEPALHQTVLAPGGCARGWITFEIPQAAKPLNVVFRSSVLIGWRLTK